MQYPALHVQPPNMLAGLAQANGILQQGKSADLQNRLLEGQIAAMPQQQAMARSEHDLKREALLAEIKTKATAEERAEMKRRANMVAAGVSLLKRTPAEQRAQTYVAIRGQLVKSGFEEDALPAEYGPDIDNNLSAYALESEELVKMLSDDADRAFKSQQPTTGQKDALYAAGGDDERARQIMAQKLTKPGTTVNVSNTNNPALGKAAQNKVEASVLDTGAQLQRLASIQESFKPEFLERGTQLSNGLSALQDKTIGGLSDEAKAELEDYTRFTTSTRNNVSRFIKEITGAAMTESEATRILGGMPNEDDGPTVFKAKLDAVARETKMAMARLNYIRKNGLEMSSVSLEGMGDIMGQRASELASRIRDQFPEMSADERIARIRSGLIQEFGLAGD